MGRMPAVSVSQGVSLNLSSTKECRQAAGGMFGIGERRIAAAVVEDDAEKLVVLLIKAVQTRLADYFLRRSR